MSAYLRKDQKYFKISQRGPLLEMKPQTILAKNLEKLSTVLRFLNAGI